MTASLILDQKPPRVSVVMAVRNGAKYLKQTLDSLAAQTFTDFELIVIDDGSQDDTPGILDACRNLSLVRLRNAQTQGLASSLNQGLDIARGEYIARLDADDLSYPARLAAQLHFLDTYREHVLVGTAYDVLDVTGRVCETQMQPLDDFSIRWQMLFHNAFCHSSVMLRRSSLRVADLHYDPKLSFAQDFDLWSRLSQYGKMANLPQALAGLRQHPDSISINNKPLQQATADEIALRNLQLLVGNQVTLQNVRYLRAWYYGLPVELSDEGKSALKLIPLLLRRTGPNVQKAVWTERLLRHRAINPLFFVPLLFALAPITTLKALLLRFLGRTAAQPERVRPIET
ncbi:MAG: glycosyltransferase family 2 protein [Alphaproteobacteria bacterium]|nr:glycosyltransferase family 2 protein [Alphaproteobacteria bacterium]